MKANLYLIQAVMRPGEISYLSVKGDISFVVRKKEATSFNSRTLALGWLTKAKALYKFYKFTVIPA